MNTSEGVPFVLNKQRGSMMTGGARNMLDSRIEDSDSDESRRKLKITEALEKEHPFAIDAKGGEKRSMMKGGA